MEYTIPLAQLDTFGQIAYFSGLYGCIADIDFAHLTCCGEIWIYYPEFDCSVEIYEDGSALFIEEFSGYTFVIA
jgi:hypothetical protein